MGLGIGAIAQFAIAQVSPPGGPHPVSQITRLGLSGISRHRYGSFAGKETEPVGGPHPVDHITRLGLAAISRHRYGSFAGKETEEIVIPPVVEGDITDTDILNLPVDYALAGKQIIKDRFRTFEHSKGKASVKTTLSTSGSTRLKGPGSSFTIKKGKL